MRERVVRRSVVLAAVLMVGGAAATTADNLFTGDTVGVPLAVDLGTVAPGELITVEVPFVLACANSSHVNPGQVVTLHPGILNPAGGGTITATETTIGPPPAEPPELAWPLDGAACPVGIAPMVSNGPTVVTIVAPLAEGENYLFQVGYSDSFEPQSSNDGTAISGLFNFASFTLDVVSNTPPTLILPDPVTQEGDVAGGAVAAYAFGATDAEDDPDPDALCTPAPGGFVPLGTTQVSCTVTDSAGLTTTGGFDLTVVDTTDPTLTGVPPGLELQTAQGGGAVLAYALPTATDVVDGDPTVACSPAPGATAPLGDSEVTCTATDDSGNQASATFPVHVSFLSATWESPVGGDPAVLVGNHGRTVPVKAQLYVDGVALTTGRVDLAAGPCGGSPVLTVPMEWRADSLRWFAHLDTALLPGPGCYTVTASVDGGGGPAFTLDLRGAVQASKPGRAGRS
jgi:hypothetical protein